MEMEMEIEHFFHDHPLSLIQDQKNYGRLRCRGCNKGLSSPSYGCNYCGFFLHKSCSQVQRQLQHCFHPCPLELTENREYICYACFEHRFGFSFHCESCNFYLDLECALMPTTVQTEGDGQIQHFTHWHPLQLVDLNKEQDEVYCSICEKLCSDVVHGCKKCKFFLHHSCMDIPRAINQHQFHPEHSLVLLTHPSYSCRGCNKNYPGLAYCCGQCDFKLDVKCALLPTADCEVAKWIQRFSHQHPLQFVDPQKEEDEVFCSICGKRCSDLIYGCKKCNFFLHQSCMDIPREINQHSFHQNHSLVLLTKSLYKCRGCEKDCSGLAYKCQPCFFELDVKCALLPTTNCEGAELIQHVYHHHPLEPCEIEDGCEACCWACRENSPGPQFTCHKCKFFLHQSCAIDVLPQAIQDHPFHPNHCLKIKSYNEKEKPGLICIACLKGRPDSNVLFYRCEDCYNFGIHLDCSRLTPSIKFGSHRHLFTLFQKGGSICFCLICNYFCRSFFLRCVNCDINLHLQCHPLAPKTLKHKHHRHPLTLTKSPLDSDLEYYGYEDEYYCDFCELPRPAEGPVYYCKECDLSADIRCVISQVCPYQDEKFDNVSFVPRYYFGCQFYQVLASVTAEDHGGITEDKDDKFREFKSYTTDPKLVKFDEEIEKLGEEIEELATELKHIDLRRMELEPQVEALQTEVEDLQTEMEELIDESSELEDKIRKLERKRLSYVAYRENRLQNFEAGKRHSAEQ